jgi:membrane protein
VVTIGGIELWPAAKTAVQKFMSSDLQGMAAEIVYHLLFSIVPLLIFLTALSGSIGQRIGVGNTVAEITTWLRTEANLPPSTVEVVLTPIEQVLANQTGGLISVGAVLALWSGKNAISALMKGLNVAYGVEETRPWWKTWGIAIGLTVALGLVAAVASFFLLTSSALGQTIARRLNLSAAWETAWSWLQLPLIAILICLVVSFFYWIGPNRHARYQLITIGSVFTVLLWTAATLGLGLYFQYMGGYVVAYGVLGGLLGFLFWLYLMSLILLFGGQLNAILTPDTEPATRVDRDEARDAAGASATSSGHPDPVAPKVAAPLTFAPTARIQDELRGWRIKLPSAEAAARHQAIARSGLDRQHRFVRAARLLGASAIAGLSALVINLRVRR